MKKYRCSRCGIVRYSAMDIGRCDCGGSYRRIMLATVDVIYLKEEDGTIKPIW